MENSSIAARDPTDRHAERQAISMAWMTTGEPLLSCHRSVVFPVSSLDVPHSTLLPATLRHEGTALIAAVLQLAGRRTAYLAAARPWPHLYPASLSTHHPTHRRAASARQPPSPTRCRRIAAPRSRHRDWRRAWYPAS